MSLQKKNNKSLPNHVAFIMDGNRRWAKKNNLSILDGHRMGSEVIKRIVKKSLKLKIKYLTFFSFSTENWNRSQNEVSDLQNLLKFYLDSEISNFIKKKINFTVIGDIEKFDLPIKNKLLEFEEKTSKFSTLFFVLALGYGSRSEIINAIKKINFSKIKHIKEMDISSNLMTSKFPDPDLVIRTSGEKRLSNFLLWQIAYSELYFTKTLWPDFNTQRFQMAINDYIQRKRRVGGD